MSSVLAVLTWLALFFGGGAGYGTAGGAKAATLPCASPHLPPAILAGSNAAVSSDVAATPLATVTATGASAPLTLAVASTEPERELGLMCVTALRRNAGMLFAFPTEQPWDFWMKNTVIPLDMIWVRADGKVTSIAANVPSSTLETPTDKVARRMGEGLFVIELRAGEAARDGITIGTVLDFPRTKGTT